MATKATREMVIDLEKQYWDAMKARDGLAATRLTADTCIVAGLHGVSKVAKDSIAELVEDAPYELKDYSLDASRAKVSTVGEDVAILAYPVHERVVRDGEPSSLDAFDLSVWVRRDGIAGSAPRTPRRSRLARPRCSRFRVSLSHTRPAP